MTARIALALALIVGLLLPLKADAAWPWKKKYERGEKVELTGIVTDADGRPLDGVQLILEASRRAFRLRHLARETVDSFRVSARTGSRGDYSVLWPWNSYYNHYELLVAVPYRKKGRDTLEILHRVNVTDAAGKGNPIVTPIQVPDVSFLNALRSFLATVDTADEKRVYQEQGQPGKVEQIGTGGSVGASWWYFDTGRIYRFEAGKLVETKTFDPVKEF